MPQTGVQGGRGMGAQMFPKPKFQVNAANLGQVFSCLQHRVGILCERCQCL